LTLPLDRGGDLAHHVYDALEDEAAQPLRDLGEQASASFSELETSLSEWSFGYGVAWALARTREPFASSRRVAELAANATAVAWRSFADQSWSTLIAADRGNRQGAEAAPVPVEPSAPQAESESQLEGFMGGLAQARSRRPREQGEPPES
jgi:hypothetical protein